MIKVSAVIVAVAASAAFGTLAMVAAPPAGGTNVREASDAPRSTPAATPALIERGRYIAKVAGCNDCHTSGYAVKGGKVDESLWLMGEPLGWQGAWGTTYAANLRLYMARLTEAQWLEAARNLQARPPMPWFNVQAMTTSDLRALYRYVRHLGPAGQPAPAYVPPDKNPSGPVVKFPEPPKK
jgi:mono/diheme cytochrome c family protein